MLKFRLKLKLTFNQKVNAGFGVILALLAISGIVSLWNLSGIGHSNERVHQKAVPVVKETNKVQIQLLKLANLSALGFNALTEADIRPYRDDFNAAKEEYNKLYEVLASLVADDPEMAGQVAEIKGNYDNYRSAVDAMFEAKLATLVAKKRVNDETEEIMRRMDDVGAALMNIVNFVPPKQSQDAFNLAAGSANYADASMQQASRVLQDLQRSNEMERVDAAPGDFEAIIGDASRWFDKAADNFAPMDREGFIDQVRRAVESVRDRLNSSPGMFDYKREQLTQSQTAWEKLGVAKEASGKAVAGLDKLLKQADGRFDGLQKELNGSVDLGFNSSIILMVVLLVLSTVNFLSMREAIRKKMVDLAKLNGIGAVLAAARDQASALDHVLHSMHEKFGVENGSVYLFNKDDELEAKAFLPPKLMDGERKAIKFTMGEGVIGRAAQTKQAIFVPDTSADRNYVGGQSERAKALICIPLVDKDILIGVMNFSGDVSKVQFGDSDFEFVSSVATSLVTTIKNIRMVEVIEEHNRNLEKKVEERTAALKQKNDDIANMLSNMHQGLFTIIEGGEIHHEYASYLEQIFETRDIAGRSFVDLLFKHCTLSTDAMDSAITSVSSIVGEDSMMFEFNAHLLVKELGIHLPGKPDKLIELDWDPIKNDDDVVTKLMVTVRDVTALRALQAEAEGQRQELAIIGEILAVNGDKFSEFLNGSSNFVEKCRSIIEQTPDKDYDRIAELFRNIHTVKGNARTYGFKFITETVHEIETTYDKLRKEEEMPWQPDELLGELDAAEEAIKRYRTVFFEKLGRGTPSSTTAAMPAGGTIEKVQAESILERIIDLSGTELPAPAASVLKDTFRLMAGVGAQTIGDVISDVVRSVSSLAGELGRATPNIVINDAGIYIRSEVHGLLNNIFMHLLRNAIDHGIESKEERLAKGKPEQGTIWVNAGTHDGKVSFAVFDNGRGLALSRIYKKAIERGLVRAEDPRPTPEQIAGFVFASGFSTADQVTEVSGRGVGMDAVKQFLTAVGGDIELTLDAGGAFDDFRSFVISISLPTKYYLETPAFQKTA